MPVISSNLAILDFVNKVCEHNIHQSIHQVREQSPILSQLEKVGALIVVGGLYQVETGIVRFLIERLKGLCQSYRFFSNDDLG